MDWGPVLVVLLIAAAVAGVLVLPLRKAWNADGAADERREHSGGRVDATARAPDDARRGEEE